MSNFLQFSAASLGTGPILAPRVWLKGGVHRGMYRDL
jgi:hypothetical protein